ncbi:hypothetical protein [Ilumatobacter sp.]
MVEVNGWVEDGFGAVADAFAANFDEYPSSAPGSRCASTAS